MRKVIVFIVGALAAGCAVGPRYVPPQVPTPRLYKEQAADAASLLQPAQPRDQAPRDKWVAGISAMRGSILWSRT